MIDDEATPPEDGSPLDDPGGAVTPTDASASEAADATARDSKPRRILLLGAAAFIVLAVGAGMWATSHERQSVHAAERPPQADRANEKWREGQGIWRLPDPTSAITVMSAESSDNGANPFLVAASSTVDPDKWLAVGMVTLPGTQNLEVARSHVLADGATVRQYVALGDKTWTEASGAGNAGSISMQSRGVDTATAFEYVSSLTQRAGDLTNVDRFAQAIDTVALPDRLTRTWDDTAQAMTHGTDGIVLGVIKERGQRFTVNVDSTGLPPDIALIRDGVWHDANRLAQVLDVGTSTTIAAPSDDPGVGWTDDGTRITATPNRNQDSGVTYPSNAESIEIVTAMRAMTRRTFDTQLTSDGITFVTGSTGSSIPVTSTTQP